MSIYSIAVSGLNAASLGLSTTGQNIANASTPGYSRQLVQQTASFPQQTGNGFVGTGVQVTTISRAYDQFLTKNLQSAQSQSSYLSTYLTNLQTVDNLVADPTSGASPAMQSFFTAISAVTTSASSIPSRTAMLTSAQSMLSAFKTLNDQFNQSAASVNGQITDTVKNVNALTSQISSLNTQILNYGSTGQPPNDLLDQRDQAVLNLNQYVKATATTQADGSVNVMIGNGQAVVVGGTAFNLAAVASPTNPQNISIAYQQNNNTVYLPDSSLAGGSLQGLLDFRNTSLTTTQNSLNLTILGLAQGINAQQRAGMDLNGNMGQNLFNIPSASSFSTSLGSSTVNIGLPSATSGTPVSDFSLAYDSAGTNPDGSTGTYTLTRTTDKASQSFSSDQMTAGFTSALGITLQSATSPTASGTTTLSFPPALGSVTANSRNTGTAQATGYISDVSKLTGSDYSFSYNGTSGQYVMTRLSDNTTSTVPASSFAAGTPVSMSMDGVTVSIPLGQQMNSGDSFNIQPLANLVSQMSVAISDPALVAAAAPITAALSTGNTGSLTLTQPTVNPPPTSTTSGATNPALQNPVTLTFVDSSHFTLTDSVTGQTSASMLYTQGMTVSDNGWSMVLNGTPAAGDSVTISKTIAGTADNRNSLAMGSLQTTKTMMNGTETYQDIYSNMVAVIGTQTNLVQSMSTAQDGILTQAQQSRDAVSGVNLDEEASNLLRYQQAYQASAKVIQTAETMFQAILGLM